MVMYSKIIVVGITFFSLIKINAQSVTFDAEFRPRSELRQGFKMPIPDTLSAALVTTQRTRFYTEYKGSYLKARLTLQDARIYGNSNNRVNSSKLELYEGWFEWNILPLLYVKFGRQELSYDDQRLLSAPKWSYTGTAHDIFLLKYEKHALSVHSGLAYNNSADNLVNTDYNYANNQNYKALSFFWLGAPLNNSFNFSIIGVCDAFEGVKDFSLLYPRFTYGVNLLFKNDSSKFEGAFTAYFQKGKNPHKFFDDNYADLNAYLIAVKMDYIISNKLKTKIGCDYYSGSSVDIEPSKSNTFNRLYGAPHSFNGSMEYFVSLPQQGLVDYYAGFQWEVNKKLSAECVFHFFTFSEDFYFEGVKAGNTIGREIDVLLNFSATKEVSVQFGVSKFFNSGVTAKYFNLNNVSLKPNHWAYLMITVRPKLYVS